MSKTINWIILGKETRPGPCGQHGVVRYLGPDDFEAFSKAREAEGASSKWTRVVHTGRPAWRGVYDGKKAQEEAAAANAADEAARAAWRRAAAARAAAAPAAAANAEAAANTAAANTVRRRRSRRRRSTRRSTRRRFF